VTHNITTEKAKSNQQNC